MKPCPHIRLVVASLLCLPAVVRAQPVTSVTSAGQPASLRPAATNASTDASDSAAAARAEYQLARERLAKADTVGAMTNLEAAARAFPAQPAYANALMTLAGRARSEAFAATALRLVNDIGLAVPASADTGAYSVRKIAGVAQLVARQDALRAPANNSRTFRSLSDSTLFPEGVSYDARSRTIYVSSLHHRNIMVLPQNGDPGLLLKDVPPNVGGIYGIAVDTVRNVIWATSAPAPGTRTLAVGDSSLPALLEISLRDGVQLRRFEIRTAGPLTSPGDITLSPRGDVLIADSGAGVLWMLPANSDSLLAIRHRLFRSLQGIVPSRDGKVAWVADYSHGLLRVELPSGRATRVADLPGHSVVGVDGLTAYGNTLIGVQNLYNPGQVLQLELNADGTRIVRQTVLDRHTLARSPTGGVVVDDTFVYIANSLWDWLDDAGNVSSTAALPRPILLRLPLGGARTR